MNCRKLSKKTGERAKRIMSERNPISFPIRLNRYIASCGISSRRKADEMILAGRVSVDGRLETSVGKALEESVRVCVDGIPAIPAKSVYIAMNKPRGVISAVSDKRCKTVTDLLPDHYRQLGVFPAGRLDKESEGLIILTNDGKFAQDLIHPSSCVERTYLVLLQRALDEKKIKEWKDGVVIEGHAAKPLKFSESRAGGNDYRGRSFEIVLGEGFKREIRLMALALGNRVVRLRRIGIGRLFLKKLPSGAFNEYNYHDLADMLRNGGEI
jgi:23S rRNA pseudouridine2605 synthase